MTEKIDGLTYRQWDMLKAGNHPSQIIASTDATWEQWSRAVIDILIDTLQVPNGDAQAIFEAQPILTVQIWHAGYTPTQAAEAIDHASRTALDRGAES